MAEPAVLSPLDTAFLRLERSGSPLHIASLAVFSGPAPSREEVAGHLATRLPGLPRYRQRLSEAPLQLGRPMWVDDPAFDLSRHVHAVAVPGPDRAQELSRLCSRLLERPLDRHRPMWETWLVQGLEHDHWALLSKVHHSMVDGIAGNDLLAHVLDVRADAGASPGPAGAPDWVPAPAPSLARRLTAGLPRPRASDLLELLTDVRGLPRAVAQTVHGTRTWLAAVRPVQRSPLIGPVGPQRDWLLCDVSLDDARKVAARLDGTVNDVVEALACSALRELLLAQGRTPHEHDVRSLVPVSVRRARPGGSEAMDANEVSALLPWLPADVAEPGERFLRVRDEMRRRKASGQAEVGEELTAAARGLPPLVLAPGLVLAFRWPHQHLTTVTTNVPGPPSTLWAMGREMLALHPFVPIADRVRLGFAVTSYAGRLWFGITVDSDHVPRAEVLVPALEKALVELM